MMVNVVRAMILVVVVGVARVIMMLYIHTESVMVTTYSWWVTKVPLFIAILHKFVKKPQTFLLILCNLQSQKVRGRLLGGGRLLRRIRYFKRKQGRKQRK